MIEGIRNWVMSVVAVGLLVSICQGLSPGGKTQKVSRLCGGLLLFLAVVTPLTRLDVTGALEEFQSYCARLSEPAEPMAKTSSELTRELVATQTERLVRTRAKELGARVSVSVNCGERDGLPVPESVTITGAISPAQKEKLRRWITKTFDIAPEHIQIREEESEETR